MKGSDFSIGIKTYSKAFGLISKLKLWKFFFIPALIGLLVGGLIITGAYYGSEPIGDWMTGWWPWEFGKETVDFISRFLGVAIILLFGLIIYKHVIMALSAPFMAPISEKIEIHLTGRELDQTDTMAEYMRSLMRGIRINVRNLLLELLMTIPLLIIGLIPVIGFFTTILVFLIQAYYSGFGNMDYTLERHHNYRESIVFVRKNKWLAIGNGFIFTLMLSIPLVGIMLTLPLSTAAATIATVDRINNPKSKKRLPKK